MKALHCLIICIIAYLPIPTHVIRCQFTASPPPPFAQKLVYSSCHDWKWSPWSNIFCLLYKILL